MGLSARMQTQTRKDVYLHSPVDEERPFLCRFFKYLFISFQNIYQYNPVPVRVHVGECSVCFTE